LNVAGDMNIEGIGNKYYVNNTPVVSSQWATSGTTIEYNGGSVGIGTSALTYKLNVNGSINATSLLVNGGAIDYNALNNKPITLVPTTTNLQLASGFNFLVGGNVGIGTTTVSTPLHIYNASSAIIRLQTGTSGTPSIELIRGTTTDGSTDWIMTNNPSTGLYNISSSVSGTSTIRFMVSNAGNVGIGGTDPLNKLHIVHNSSTSATSGGISLMVENQIDGANQNSIIHNRVAFVNTANIRKAVYSWGNGTNNGWSAYLLAGNTANGNLRFNRTINNANTTDDTLVLNIDGSVSIPQGSLSVLTSISSATLNNTGVATTATLNSTTLNNTGVVTTATLNSTTLNNTGVATIGTIITPTTTTGIKLNVLGTGADGIVATFKESSNLFGLGVKFNGLVALGTTNQGQDEIHKLPRIHNRCKHLSAYFPVHFRHLLRRRFIPRAS
jgi:hypothetical protein